ncbi:class I SAM-dependent methyltransferase [Agrobacterium rosae]|uniref:class I SAM-dependent methyltransferase n=1 Tax=Agrobacterium rosae TaxID=1972867 RepID=UPI003A8072FC
MRESIVIEELASEVNFDETLYLKSNPDVAASIDVGHFASGREHFLKHGKIEGRKFRYGVEKIAEAREAKLKKVEPLLRTDMNMTQENGKLNFLTSELRKSMRIVSTDNISAHGYADNVLELISRHDLVLDCGCGRRPEYFHNVVNYEIVDYDTTDVIGVGERLPFKDNSFDAVVSIAVLEHVRDPFTCAQEISRVLKPGGELYCSVPFLQPYHGYPHHYFNATHQGIQRLFEDDLDIHNVSSEGAGHPIFTLHWLLRSWVHGLPDETKKQFTSMSIAEILASEPDVFLSNPISNLNDETLRELACSFEMTATKPTRARKFISSFLPNVRRKVKL